MHPHRVSSLLLALAASPPAFATLSFTSLATHCTAPAAFDACWKSSVSNAQTCIATSASCTKAGASCTDENNCSSTKASCNTDCMCGAYGSWLNCALSTCWNMVYSCEYQNLAIQTVANCPSAGYGPLNTIDADNYIPYVPAPIDAPSACSCDISHVLYRHQASGAHGADCAKNLTASDTAGLARCQCCAASEAVSDFYNTCATTTPLDLPLWNSTLSNRLAELNSAACQAVFDPSPGFDCRTLGFEKPGISGGPFLDNQHLPTNGTQSLFNVPGNVIASPLAGPTLVWQLGARFGNLTAVAAFATSATSSTSSPTQSATAAASTSTSSSADSMRCRNVDMAVFPIFMMAAIALWS